MNRYYDPVTGQFISVDPMVGSTGTPFAYAGDNPSDSTDFFGLCGYQTAMGYLQLFPGSCKNLAAAKAAIRGYEKQSYSDMHPGLLSEVLATLKALPQGVSRLQAFNKKFIDPYLGDGPSDKKIVIAGGLRHGSTSVEARNELEKVGLRVPSDYKASPVDDNQGWIFRPPGGTGNNGAFRAMDDTENPARYPNGYGMRYNSAGAPTTPSGRGLIGRDSTHVPFEEDDFSFDGFEYEAP